MSAHSKKLLRDRIPEAPIVLLAKPLVIDERSFTIQNFHVKGELVIPLFSSQAALQESTQGTDLGLPPVTIKREFLASILHGDEVFLLDPQLQSELRFTASEFRRAFPEL
jgi:SseB protein N-terminal domain